MLLIVQRKLLFLKVSTTLIRKMSSRTFNQGYQVLQARLICQRTSVHIAVWAVTTSNNTLSAKTPMSSRASNALVSDNRSPGFLQCFRLDSFHLIWFIHQQWRRLRLKEKPLVPSSTYLTHVNILISQERHFHDILRSECGLHSYGCWTFTVLCNKTCGKRDSLSQCFRW